MVPEGWRDATLGDLVKLQRGHDLPGHSRQEGEIEVIGGGGPNGFHNVAKASAPGIVIGRSGSGIGNAWWTDKPFWPLNTGMYVTDFLRNDPRFCFLWLDWIDFTSHNSGGAQPSLNRNFIYPIPLPLPPLAEQKKIAEILSTWDRAIEVAEAQLEAAHTSKRALMQQLLTGKRRFPEFDGEEWKEVALIEIATPIKSRNEGEELPVLTISSRSGYVRQDQKFARYMAGESVNRYYVMEKGEFAYNKGNSKTFPFGCVMRMDEFKKGLVPHVYVCFSLNDGYDTDFYNGLFLADYLKPQLSRLVNTGVRNNGLLNISPRAFWTVKVPVPPLEEQHRLGETIKAAFREEELCEEKITKLRTEKKALMQQLLTGKRRVSL